MKHHHRAFAVAGALLFVGRAAIGCAGNDTSDADVTGTPSTDASNTDASVEPSPDDAGPYVNADAKTDADAGTCSADGWCYSVLPAQSSFDAGDLPPDIRGLVFSLRSVWVAPDHQAWAVSDAGHILRWDGKTWTVVTIAPEGLQSIWGSSATDLWLAGNNGLVLHATGSAGQLTFETVPTGTTQTITRIWGTSASDVWAVGDRVYHLGAGESGTPAFVPVNVPNGYPYPEATATYTTVWGSAKGVWIGGSESVNVCDDTNCSTLSRFFVAKWNGDPGDAGDTSWDHVALPFGNISSIPVGTSTSDGVELAALKGFLDEGSLLRVAEDAGALQSTLPDGGTINSDGPYSWTQELAETYGAPEGLWASSSKDVWLVGASGVVRHYDGTSWQLGRVALSPIMPLLSNLHSVHGTISPSGEQDIWIVGDDVALHRTVKP